MGIVQLTNVQRSLVQETMPPPADMAPPFEYHPAPWRTAGAGHRLGRAAVVKLSSRINVQWRTSTPVEAAFVALSMYAPWEKPYRITAGNRRYADGAVHRLISDLSVFVSQ